VSWYPCDFHGKRVDGKLGSVYPSLVRGVDRFNRHLRVCDECWPGFLSVYGERWVEMLVDSEPLDPVVCAACGQSSFSPSQLDPLFVTAFVGPHRERSDWFGRYCPACGDGLIESLSLGRKEGGSPLRAA
jgi:hypothetical protein